MRRLFVTVIALLLVLGTAAAPASAKRDKPDKPQPGIILTKRDMPSVVRTDC